MNDNMVCACPFDTGGRKMHEPSCPWFAQQRAESSVMGSYLPPAPVAPSSPAPLPTSLDFRWPTAEDFKRAPLPERWERLWTGPSGNLRPFAFIESADRQTLDYIQRVGTEVIESLATDLASARAALATAQAERDEARRIAEHEWSRVKLSMVYPNWHEPFPWASRAAPPTTEPK